MQVSSNVRQKMRYRVTYYYYASGMENHPDIRDYGEVEANSKEKAIEFAMKRKNPVDKKYGPNNSYSSWDWIRNCLSAEEINV